MDFLCWPSIPMVFPISISDPSSLHPIHKQNLLVQPLRHPEYDLSFYIVVWAAIFLHLNYYKYLQTKLSPSPAPPQPLTPDCSHHIQWAFKHWSQVTPCPAQRPAGAPVSEANHGPRDGPQCVVCPPLLPSPLSPLPPTLPLTHSSPATRVSLLPLNTPDTTFPLLVLRYLGILLSFFLPISTERSPHQWSFPDQPI